jgi:hypothetical protein
MEPPQVWGTCAVNDHHRPGAFVREILLFDRIVVPYPDTEDERQRWHDANPVDPLETWAPERLDELLDVLGTQKKPGREGARLAWTAPWSHKRWVEERTRREVADIVAVDAYEFLDAYGTGARAPAGRTGITAGRSPSATCSSPHVRRAS